jgi:hypothetical protein
MADKKKAAGKPVSSRAKTPATPKKAPVTRSGAKRGGKTLGRGSRPRTNGSSPRVPKASGSRTVGKAKAREPRGKSAANAAAEAADLAGPIPGLSEEDAIRSAKYLPRNLPPRLFEEERFLFPESYGIDRIRLLVRDPEWLFAYWDVSPKSLEALRRQVGDRAAAVARLTLRIGDPVSGGASDILLPPGARWWYVRADSARRSYRAELGFTLASGDFRPLAKSNTVTTPRVGPSPESATRRLSYRQAGEISPAAGAAVRQEEMRSGSANGPWSAPNVDGTTQPPDPSAAPPARGGGRGQKGGASDAYRPGGASDVHRR